MKTSGAKGVHVFVPLTPGTAPEAAAAACRALAARAERLDPALATTAYVKEDRAGKVFLDSTRAGGATVVATLQSAGPAGSAGVLPRLLGRAGPDHAGGLHPHHRRRASWTAIRGARALPAPQSLPEVLVAEGHEIPIARVQAMHEGKRRARARRDAADDS